MKNKRLCRLVKPIILSLPGLLGTHRMGEGNPLEFLREGRETEVNYSPRNSPVREVALIKWLVDGTLCLVLPSPAVTWQKFPEEFLEDSSGAPCNSAFGSSPDMTSLLPGVGWGLPSSPTQYAALFLKQNVLNAFSLWTQLPHLHCKAWSQPLSIHALGLPKALESKTCFALEVLWPPPEAWPQGPHPHLCPLSQKADPTAHRCLLSRKGARKHNARMHEVTTWKLTNGPSFSIFYVPGTVPEALRRQTQFIPTVPLRGRCCYHTHFPDEKTEAWRIQGLYLFFQLLPAAHSITADKLSIILLGPLVLTVSFPGSYLLQTSIHIPSKLRNRPTGLCCVA